MILDDTLKKLNDGIKKEVKLKIVNLNLHKDIVRILEAEIQEFLTDDLAMDILTEEANNTGLLAINIDRQFN